jgi:hypothetical protein
MLVQGEMLQSHGLFGRNCGNFPPIRRRRGQVLSLLEKRVGDAVTVGASRGEAGCEIGVEFLADGLQLTLFEFGDGDSVPALRGADERAVQ